MWSYDWGCTLCASGDITSTQFLKCFFTPPLVDKISLECGNHLFKNIKLQKGCFLYPLGTVAQAFKLLSCIVTNNKYVTFATVARTEIENWDPFDFLQHHWKLFMPLRNYIFQRVWVTNNSSLCHRNTGAGLTLTNNMVHTLVSSC